MRTDPATPVAVSEDGTSREYEMTIKGWEIYSGDSLITDETEREIFDFLLSFGSWAEQDSVPLMKGKVLEGIEFRWQPPEDEEKESSQRFRMIGSLTSMFSTWFRRQALGADRRPSQTRIEVVPGFLGRLIPEGYHGNQLALWIFVQRPNFDA